jgi:peptide/nickel transport system permease protein
MTATLESGSFSQVSAAPVVADDERNVQEARTKSRKWGTFFWVCIGWLGVVTICAVGDKHLPWVTSEPDYLMGATVTDGKWWKSFGWAHPLGTNGSGDDWLSYATRGARNSLIIAFATVIFGFLFGGLFGMLAGYFRKWVDSGLSFVTTVLLSFPPLLFIILLISLLSAGVDAKGVEQGLQTNVLKLSLSLGVLSIPILFRVVRAATMQFASREFVLAARAMGARPARVLMREILPNVMKPMAAYGLVTAGNVMVIEGSLSYLGIGVGTSPAWGKMIQSGGAYTVLKRSPNVAFIPAFILFFTVLSFNFIGDRVRERLEVKEGAL